MSFKVASCLKTLELNKMYFYPLNYTLINIVYKENNINRYLHKA